MAASQELKDRMMYENRGHCLLEACRQADLSKVKKFLSSSSNTSAYVAELLAFKHPYSGDNAVHCTVVSPFPKRKAIGKQFLVRVEFGSSSGRVRVPLLGFGSSSGYNLRLNF